MQYWKLGILLSCMVVVGGISTASSPLERFTSVIEAQAFIEDTIQIRELQIKQTIPYSVIYNALEQKCDATVIKEAKKLAELLKTSWASGIRSQNVKSEMERRFTMLKNLIPALKTKDEKLFCKQKYLTYSLMEYTQQLYGGSTPLVSQASTKVEQKTPVVQLPVEQVLGGQEALHPSADTSEHYLTFINNDHTLSKTELPISQLAEQYLQKEIGKLISLGFLKPADLEILDEKIELNYVAGCGTTRGSYHMTQKTDGSNKKFKMIKLNINLCNSQQYLANFERYSKQIFIHELGHYFYYFKDSHSSMFGNLCRSKGVNSCETTDFVSSYAQKNKEEDYAESFAHWYLETYANSAMIVDQEHGSADTSSKIKMTKDQYFDYAFA